MAIPETQADTQKKANFTNNSTSIEMSKISALIQELCYAGYGKQLTVEDIKIILSNLNYDYKSKSVKKDFVAYLQAAIGDNFNLLLFNMDLYQLRIAHAYLCNNEEPARAMSKIELFSDLTNKAKELGYYPKKQEETDIEESLVDEFRDLSAKSSPKQLMKKYYVLNRKIYEIANHRGGYRPLDYTIFSENIVKNFDKVDLDDRGRHQVVYQMSAFAYICELFVKNHTNNLLIEITDDYFQNSSVNSRILYTDLYLNKSGSTRCKSRFQSAIWHLKENGLLHYTNVRKKISFEDDDGNRISKDVIEKKYIPSLFGMVLYLYLKMTNNLKPFFTYLIPTDDSYYFSPDLVHIVKKINHDDGIILDEILSNLNIASKKIREKAKKIINEYLQFLSDNLILSNDMDGNYRVEYAHKADVYKKTLKKFLKKKEGSEDYWTVFNTFLHAQGIKNTGDTKQITFF